MVKGSRKRDKKAEKEIVKERIDLLMGLAVKCACSGELELAHQHVESVLNLATRYNYRLPRKIRRLFCKHCHHFLAFGINADSLIDSSKRRVEVLCRDCGRKTFWPYNQEKKK